MTSEENNLGIKADEEIRLTTLVCIMHIYYNPKNSLALRLQKPVVAGACEYAVIDSTFSLT